MSAICEANVLFKQGKQREIKEKQVKEFLVKTKAVAGSNFNKWISS